MGKGHVAKELKFTELRGISKRQIEEHHGTLYKGYVRKLNEIEEKLQTADPAEANATFSQIRELKMEKCFATNAMYLHEGYFANLGGDGKAKGKIAELITQDFGSLERWEKDFRAAGIAARGWVVLAYNWYDRRLHNYSSDYHTQGIWNSSPLLILDVYEHAYMIDFGVARAKYLDAFFANIDWDEVNKRVEALRIEAHRKGTI
ncbi:MAG: superoxide dismutase [candidate division NC10 bacterium]|nr:superoxide dismutase [candidate division NC10 bacterium]